MRLVNTSDSLKRDQAFISRLLSQQSPLLNFAWLQSMFGLEKYAQPRGLVEQLLMLQLVPGFTSTPLFIPEWYRRQTGAESESTTYFSLLQHYVDHGEAFGFSPNPFFPVDVYLERNPDLKSLVFPSQGALLSHFIQNGLAERREQTLLFDVASYGRYFAFDSETAARSGIDEFSHYVYFGWREGRVPNPLMDESWYVTHNQDVATLIKSGDYPNGFSHFVNVGEREGRTPTPFFSPTQYIELNPDLVQVPSSFLHYWGSGLREKRLPSRSAVAIFVGKYFGHNYPNSTLAFDGTSCRRVINPAFENSSLMSEEDRVGPRALVRDILTANLSEAVHTKNSQNRQAAERVRPIISEIAKPHIVIDTPELPSITANSASTIFLHGIAQLPGCRLTAIAAAGSGLRISVKHFLLPCLDTLATDSVSSILDQTAMVGFLATLRVRVGDLAPGPVRIELTFQFQCGAVQREFVHEGIEVPIDSPVERVESHASTQVCMATFNPKEAETAPQLRSILNQTVSNLALIVSDDASITKSARWLAQVATKDSRIHLSTVGQNRGFVANFERAVRRASRHAEYISLSDQDDVWYSDKLEVLHDALRHDHAVCAYSDMRITRPDGAVIAGSFWEGRKNHVGGPIAFAIANTVTGAAAMFKADLLPYLLPFPRFMGLYHDQWLSVIASALGEIAYVDKPLYDYIQHGKNVLGFAGSRGTEITARRVLCRRVRQLRKLDPSKWSDRDCEYIALAIQHLNSTGLQRYVLLQSALERLPHWHNSTSRECAEHFCNMLSGRASNVLLIKKFIRHLRREQGGDHALLGIDYLLEASLIAAGLLRQVGASALTRLVAWARQVEGSHHKFNSFHGRTNTTDFERKIWPIQTRALRRQKLRLTMLIPELRLKTFFGGYYSKIALANQIRRAGVDVRLVLLDEAVPSHTEMLEIANSFPELCEALTECEVAAVGSRATSIAVSAKDALMATTWWSAHVAEAMRVATNRQSFLYLIQEYEPFTFPLGTWYRAAEQTYEYPHIPIFSTPILMDYFKAAASGVFSQLQAPVEGENYMCFYNPIVAPAAPGARTSTRKPRVLFYARPQLHAARNMFDFGLASLRKVASKLRQGGDSWEFLGIGAPNAGELELVPGVNLRLIEKLNAADYRELLASASVGVALMYTPHPSLIPIEMAAAGLHTVTNSCFTKTQGSLAPISERIIVAPPTIPGIANAIEQAMRAASRATAAPVVKRIWPRNPSEAFPSDWVQRFLDVAQQTLPK